MAVNCVEMQRRMDTPWISLSGHLGLTLSLAQPLIFAPLKVADSLHCQSHQLP